MSSKPKTAAEPEAATPAPPQETANATDNKRAAALSLLWVAIVAILIIELVWLIIPTPTAWIEAYYTSGLFAVVITPLVAFHQLAPISLTTVIGIAAVPVVIGGLFWGVRRARRSGTPWRNIAWGTFQCFTAAFVVLYGWFLLTFGVGYKREPIDARLGLTQADRVTRADLDATMDDMLAVIAANVENPEDRDEAGALRSISDAMGDMATQWDGHRPPLPDDVKRLPGGLLILFGAYGIDSPFLMEPHVDGALPGHAIVNTGAHELAHVAGFSGEADATLAGLLAGLRAEAPYAKYACALAAYASLCAELGPQDQRKRFEALPAEALNDLRDEAAVYQRYTRNVTHSVFQPMYHSYLVTQGVTEGIEDYSRGTRLFVNAWQKGLGELPQQDSD